MKFMKNSFKALNRTYILPKELRKELGESFGISILGRKNEVSKAVKAILEKKNLKKIITVGDYCSLFLPSDIKIFDGKIQRKKIKKSLKFSFSCSNPQGTIQSRTWAVIKKAIKTDKNIFIKGEEDLLVIPCVLLAKNHTAVIYGLPKKGICLIEVNLRTKKYFKELLKKFHSN